MRDQVQLSLGATYTILRELGGGGMSRVFLAEEKAFGRMVVIKVLSPEKTQGILADRFEREIKLAANLQHPHISSAVLGRHYRRTSLLYDAVRGW